MEANLNKKRANRYNLNLLKLKIYERYFPGKNLLIIFELQSYHN